MKTVYLKQDMFIYCLFSKFNKYDIHALMLLNNSESSHDTDAYNEVTGKVTCLPLDN